MKPSLVTELLSFIVMFLGACYFSMGAGLIVLGLILFVIAIEMSATGN